MLVLSVLCLYILLNKGALAPPSSRSRIGFLLSRRSLHVCGVLAHARDLKLPGTLPLLHSAYQPQPLLDRSSAPQHEQRREEAHDRGEPKPRAAGVLQVGL
jgi:hypothetical protein